MGEYRTKVLVNAAYSEDVCNKIKNVSGNSIQEERDVSTDKYTMHDGVFYDDFNVALQNLFADQDVIDEQKKISDGIDSVNLVYSKLKNPPKKFEDSYEIAKDMYEYWYTFSQLAIDPNGSYNSFSSDFLESDNGLIKSYGLMDSSIPEQYVDNYENADFKYD